MSDAAANVRLDALFERTLELDGEARERLLQDIDASDPALGERLRELLRLAASEVDILPASQVAGARWQSLYEADTAIAATEIHGLPGRIGAWVPLRRIGQGGMGTVFLVERNEDGFRQTAALKLLRPGIETDVFLQRFAEERRILAGLTHPGIARLLDGGRHRDGRPYLVMEYVDGEPVDRACDRRALDIDARIALFLRIAEAVAYAHRSLIAHRDLKPGNILVDADGAPHLLDFGIAKALPETPGETDATGTAIRAFTPDYAAPEQVLGQPTSTATDVYQLGLLLYELLCGHRAQHAADPSQRAIERAVCEIEPLGPSERIADDDRERCAARASGPAALRRKLRGDLDNIALKALRKAPERRYASVTALIDDLQRWQRGLTVRARPETWRYRTGKFLRRNALATAATVTIFALVLGYAVTATRQADALARERDRARAEAAKTRQTLDLLGRVFRSADPRMTGGVALSARDVLDAGWNSIEHEADVPADVEAEVAGTLAQTYRRLGEYRRALTLSERALQAARTMRPPQPALLAGALRDRGRVLTDLARYEEAERDLRSALAHYRRRGRDGEEDIATTSIDLGGALLLRGDAQSAEALYRAALDIRRRLRGEDDPDVVEALSVLGVAQRQKGDYAEARRTLENALALRRKLLPPRHPDLHTSLSNLALVLGDLGRHDEAEALYRESIDGLERSFGTDNPDRAIVMNNLALLLRNKGEDEDALRLLRETLRIRLDNFGERHPLTAANLNDIGLLLSKRQDSAGAESFYRRALAAYPEGDSGIGATTFNLGQLAERRGDFAEAERLYRRAVDLQTKDFGADHDRVGADLNRLGIVLHRRGQLNEAEIAIRRALTIYRKRLPADHPRIAGVQLSLGALLIERRAHDEARTLLLDAVRIRTAAFGAEDERTQEAMRTLARVPTVASAP